MAEVVSSMLSGVGNILLLNFFCFHLVKPVMPILSFLSILCVREKLLFINNHKNRSMGPVLI